MSTTAPTLLRQLTSSLESRLQEHVSVILDVLGDTSPNPVRRSDVLADDLGEMLERILYAGSDIDTKYFEDIDIAAPPTNIDFLAEDLHPPYAPTQCRYLSPDCVWLGGPHDGYPLVPLHEYMKIRCSDLHALSAQALAALEQSLFTFGLLEAVMCIKIPESFLLTRRADGTVVIIGEKISVLLRDWRYRIVKHNGRGERPWPAQVEPALRLTYRLLNAVTMAYPHLSSFELAWMNERSVGDLLFQFGAIAIAVYAIYHVFPCDISPQPIYYGFDSVVDASPFSRCMRAQGWCPFTLSILEKSGSVALGYASTRKPFVRQSMDNHKKCSREGCGVNNVDVSRYTNPHTRPSCKCRHSSPPLDDVKLLLSRGAIPVVVPTELGYTIQEASDTSYIAISHVWADGLGSVTEDGLPSCQLDRLVRTVKSLPLSTEGEFWMDALCVPGERELRKRAIGLMAQTYAQATAVLVVDAGIRSCSKDAPMEEKLLRVVTSGWMQRLWTLQEAMLAQELYFEFSDGVLSIRQFLPSTLDDLSDPLLSTLGAEIYLLTGSRLPVRRKRGLLAPLSLSEVARFVKWRTTSKAEDETLALAGLVDVDALALLAADPASGERMAAFLQRVRDLTPDIVFLSVERLAFPNFGWAPRSLMISGVDWGVGAATCTATGLLAEYVLLRFAPTDVNEASVCIVQDTIRRQTYRLRFPGGKPTRYRFNAIILEGLPQRRDTVPGGLVEVKGRDAAPHQDRLVCEFRKSVLLEESPNVGRSDIPIFIRAESSTSRRRVRLI